MSDMTKEDLAKHPTQREKAAEAKAAEEQAAEDKANAVNQLSPMAVHKAKLAAELAEAEAAVAAVKQKMTEVSGGQIANDSVGTPSDPRYGSAESIAAHEQRQQAS